MHVESGAVLHKQFDPNEWDRPLLWLQARLAHQRGPFGNLSGHIGRKLRRMLPSSRGDLRLPSQEGLCSESHSAFDSVSAAGNAM